MNTSARVDLWCRLFGLLIVLLFRCPQLLPAQDSAQAENSDSTQFLTGYPLVFYFPETNW